ncbi:MAG: extracellular solute-binding protein [Actinobacteria bacterium]|nr:extracellular solute-binding protein [Actinomycetota bacterium]MTA29286.1 extracellular solute-binding protein [Actinomycetota bacterium]
MCEGSKMKLGKIAAVIASAALLTTTLTVASPASAVQNLVVWADKGTIDTIKTRVQAWDTANADYTVSLVQKDFSTVRDALKVAVPKGQGPDILAGAAHDWVGNLVKANVLLPIDAQLPANFKDDFIPGALQAMKYNGHYYGVPGWTENIAFLRNMKVAKTKVTSINQVKNGEIGINYSATTSDPYHFYPFQTMFDAPVFTMDSGGDWTETVGMGGTKGANFAKWLKTKGTAFFGKPADAKILCNFLNGKIKYWVTGAWNINAIESGASGCKKGLVINSTYSIDPFPKGPTGITPKQFLGIRGYLMVASGPNNTTNVAGATLLMRYMSSEATQFSLYDNFNKTPANKAALNRAKDNPVIKGFADAANTVPMPNSPAMDAAWVIWGKAQTRIIQGKESKPDVAWSTMTKALQTAINKLN